VSLHPNNNISVFVKNLKSPSSGRLTVSRVGTDSEIIIVLEGSEEVDLVFKLEDAVELGLLMVALGMELDILAALKVRRFPYLAVSGFCFYSS
jgi:hypothetical protein